MRTDHPDKVAVCLKITGEDYQSDAMLPSDMKGDRLAEGLLRLLQECEPMRFSSYEALKLSCGGRSIGPEDSLASLGIWDGSTIIAAKAPEKTGYVPERPPVINKELKNSFRRTAAEAEETENKHKTEPESGSAGGKLKIRR